MRRLILILLCCLTLAACAGTSAQTSSTIGTSTTTSVQPVTSTTSPATTTTQPVGPPVAWIAPSGVPLAVQSWDGETATIITPCGDSSLLSEGAPIYEVAVVIDPGHGGPVDTGAVGPNGLAEKEINLRVALETAATLEQRGIPTMVTRSGDYPIPIRTRVEYAHLMGAEVLVSVHHNAPRAPSSEIPGVEIFVQHDSPESQRLGGLLFDRSMTALDQFEVDWDRSPDAGVMTVINSDGNDAYGLVRLPEIPSALVELGFIANQAEAELYRHPDYVPAAAGALVDAIASFLDSTEMGADLTEGRNFNPSSGVGRDQCVEPDLDLALYPDVTSVEVDRGENGYTFSVTVSSPYDTPDRYADAFRVVGDDGQVYGIRELTHDHANEQPFTRPLGGVEIPDSVVTVTVEARDQVYGWGGETVTVSLP